MILPLSNDRENFSFENIGAFLSGEILGRLKNKAPKISTLPAFEYNTNPGYCFR
jgi:hypothetical protein